MSVKKRTQGNPSERELCRQRFRGITVIQDKEGQTRGLTREGNDMVKMIPKNSAINNTLLYLKFFISIKPMLK